MNQSYLEKKLKYFGLLGGLTILLVTSQFITMDILLSLNILFFLNLMNAGGKVVG